LLSTTGWGRGSLAGVCLIVAKYAANLGEGGGRGRKKGGEKKNIGGAEYY